MLYAGLFSIGVLSLLFELLFIRIFPAKIPLIERFQYIPLIASCFGMGLGCAFPRKFPVLQNYFIVVFILTAAIPLFSNIVYFNKLWFPKPYFVAFDGIVAYAVHISISFSALLIIFVMISLFFFLLGQHLGKDFALCKNPLIGYTINMGGNLAGIITFNIVSFLANSPVLLLAIGTILLLQFYYKRLEMAAFLIFIVILIWAESNNVMSELNGDNLLSYGIIIPLYGDYYIFLAFLVFLLIAWSIAKKYFWNAYEGYKTRFNWHLFFMGSAFMVIETGGISNLSIRAGSCLLGNSLIISLVFMFMFAANFYVLRRNKSGFNIPYLCLALCLFLALLVNTNQSTPWFMENIFITGIIFSIPVFFSSIIFARAIKNVQQPEIAIGSNLLGCVLGGSIEPVSMYGGSAALPVVALVLYGVSYIFLTPKNIPCLIGK